MNRFFCTLAASLGMLVFAPSAADAQPAVYPHGMQSSDIISGIYAADDAGSCCWVAPHAEIRAVAPPGADTLLLNVYLPDFSVRSGPNALSVQIDAARTVRRCCLGAGEHELTIPLAPRRAWRADDKALAGSHLRSEGAWIEFRSASPQRDAARRGVSGFGHRRADGHHFRPLALHARRHTGSAVLRHWHCAADASPSALWFARVDCDRSVSPRLFDSRNDGNASESCADCRCDRTYATPRRRLYERALCARFSSWAARSCCSLRRCCRAPFTPSFTALLCERRSKPLST